MPLTTEIADYLAAGGLGLVPATNLFEDSLPDTPAAAVAVFGTGGSRVEYTHDKTAGPAYIAPSFQILCRDPDPVAARVRADAIHARLSAVRNQTIGGIWYLRITPSQPAPFLIGRDQNQLAEYACNYVADKETS